MRQEKIAKEELTLDEIGQLLWKTAAIPRGAVRSEGYGNYILSLLSFKRLCDVYSEEYQAFLEEFESEEIAAKKFHRFLIPEGCLWDDTNVGQKLNDALAQIAKFNPRV